MPWNTPTLREVRTQVRDHIRGSLPGADASVPNSVLRVMSDAQGGLCHLTLQYLDWLALQLLPDTAEREWLDRHGDIWLVNADATVGRKMATFAVGVVAFTGEEATVVPIATQAVLQASGIGFETTAEIIIGNGPTDAPVRALDPGEVGNLEPGTILSVGDVPGVTEAVVVALSGGTETENDEDLRFRILARIRQPPMGGAKHDYEAWALSVGGVTRAWCSPMELGMGTVTVRFMMDDLRADVGGFPNSSDIAVVKAYLDTVRPVAVRDFYVYSPIPRPINIIIEALAPDTESTRAAIEESVKSMIAAVAMPKQTIYAAWKYHAIMEAAGVDSFRLRDDTDDVMPSAGHMAVLGDISYF